MVPYPVQFGIRFLRSSGSGSDFGKITVRFQKVRVPTVPVPRDCLPVSADCADDGELEPVRQLLHELQLAVAPVDGDVSALDFVALINIVLQGLDASLRRPPYKNKTRKLN